MCRIAAYVGPGVSLASVLYDPPHSLEHQAYAPRQMLMGNVNVDGTGLAWWPADAPADEPPLRYVSERPPWSDPNLPGLAPRVEARMLLAAVRSATPGVPFGSGNIAPFVHGRLAAVHNGWLGRFREQTGRELAARLPEHLYARVDAVSDSLLVVLTVVKHHEERGEADLPGALRAATAEILDICAGADAEATLNVAVGDGERIVGVRTSRGTEGNNPVHFLQGGTTWPGGTLLASEPLDDDPAWEPVPDDHLFEVTAEGITVGALDAGAS